MCWTASAVKWIVGRIHGWWWHWLWCSCECPANGWHHVAVHRWLWPLIIHFFIWRSRRSNVSFFLSTALCCGGTVHHRRTWWSIHHLIPVHVFDRDCVWNCKHRETQRDTERVCDLDTEIARARDFCCLFEPRIISSLFKLFCIDLFRFRFRMIVYFFKF